jgi:hypothetical protein
MGVFLTENPLKEQIGLKGEIALRSKSALSPKRSRWTVKHNVQLSVCAIAGRLVV